MTWVSCTTGLTESPKILLRLQILAEADLCLLSVAHVIWGYEQTVIMRNGVHALWRWALCWMQVGRRSTEILLMLRHVLLPTIATWAEHLTRHVGIDRSVSLHLGLLIVIIVLSAVYDYSFALHRHTKVSIWIVLHKAIGNHVWCTKVLIHHRRGRLTEVLHSIGTCVKWSLKSIHLRRHEIVWTKLLLRLLLESTLISEAIVRTLMICHLRVLTAWLLLCHSIIDTIHKWIHAIPVDRGRAKHACSSRILAASPWHLCLLARPTIGWALPMYEVLASTLENIARIWRTHTIFALPGSLHLFFSLVCIFLRIRTVLLRQSSRWIHLTIDLLQ